MFLSDILEISKPLRFTIHPTLVGKAPSFIYTYVCHGVVIVYKDCVLFEGELTCHEWRIDLRAFLVAFDNLCFNVALTVVYKTGKLKGIPSRLNFRTAPYSTSLCMRVLCFTTKK